jgi:hypothetical protein
LPHPFGSCILPRTIVKLRDVMNKDIEDLYKHASDYFEKYQDEELRDYLLAVAQRLEDADMMFHQFAYFLMHARSTVAFPVRPKHFQEALDRAEKYIQKYGQDHVEN